MQLVNDRLERHLNDLQQLSVDDLLEARYVKFRNIAQFYTAD
jgi:acetyl-CoA carboxylase carboxyl transferase subunit alpha